MNPDVILHRSDQMGKYGSGRGREEGVGGEARIGREGEKKRGEKGIGLGRGGPGGGLNVSQSTHLIGSKFIATIKLFKRS